MRVACVQSDVAYGDPATNAKAAIAELERLADQGVHLAVFPEAFLTGYCVSTPGEAHRIAIPTDHPSLHTLHEAANRLGMLAVIGFAEKGADGASFNTAAIFLPEGPAFYRKSHLPELGLDKFVEPGSELRVWDTPHGKLGVAICFDLRPPEVCRVLALKGAELIVLPTNWPDGATFAPTFIAPVRAAENRVFLATCNRVGKENGFGFVGLSGIYSPTGEALAKAGPDAETIVADLDIAEARFKRTVTIPGLYETTTFDSRRPELYGPIVEPRP